MCEFSKSDVITMAKALSEDCPVLIAQDILTRVV